MTEEWKPRTIEELDEILCNPEETIQKRFRAMFEVRGLQNPKAVETMIKCFNLEPKSDLLRHEVAYCLGQMNTRKENCDIIEPFLQKVLEERKHSSIVIHETVEALGNLSPDNTREILAKFDEEKDDMIVKETCELALDLTNWKQATRDGETEGLDLNKLKHITNDPAPPFNPECNPNYKDLEWLTKVMLDPKE